MIDFAALHGLVARIRRSTVELEAFFADRAGYLAPLKLDGATVEFVLQHLDAPARVQLALWRKLQVEAIAAQLRRALPHTLDTVARHRAVDDALFEQLLARPTGERDPSSAFAQLLAEPDGAGAPCRWLGDLARLEQAVGRARALRPRLLRFLATDGARVSFVPDGDRRVARNRWFPTVTLAHDLPWADFPLHLSARPPVTWPVTLPERRVALAACIEPSPPHALVLVELDGAQLDLLARADGTRVGSSFGAQLAPLAAAGLIGFLP